MSFGPDVPLKTGRPEVLDGEEGEGAVKQLPASSQFGCALGVGIESGGLAAQHRLEMRPQAGQAWKSRSSAGPAMLVGQD